MKQYTIKKAVDELTARDYNILTRFLIYYELQSIDYFNNFDFNDDFIFCIYANYIDNRNYFDIYSYCNAIFNYFEANEIDPANIKTVKELTEILRDIY